MYYQCSENKGADQLCSYCTLICAFVFAYVDYWFSGAATHEMKTIIKTIRLKKEAKLK